MTSENMKCPSKEDYKLALEENKTMDVWIRLERKRIDTLLSDLVKAKLNLDMYTETFHRNKLTISTYEVYQELKKGKS